MVAAAAAGIEDLEGIEVEADEDGGRFEVAVAEGRGCSILEEPVVVSGTGETCCMIERS